MAARPKNFHGVVIVPLSNKLAVNGYDRKKKKKKRMILFSNHGGHFGSNFNKLEPALKKKPAAYNGSRTVFCSNLRFEKLEPVYSN